MMSQNKCVCCKYFTSSNNCFDSINENNETPLFIAVYNNNFEIVKTLLENNANPNITNKNKISPLHYAIKNNNFEITNILLEYNAYNNIQDIKEYTPLHMAVIFADLKIIKLLVEEFYVDINYTNYQNETPFDIAKLLKKKDIINYFTDLYI